MTDRTDETDGWRLRPWYILGCGRLGTALGVIANRLDVTVRATWNRSESAARRVEASVAADAYRWGDDTSEAIRDIDDAPQSVIWLTVSDDVLSSVAVDIGRQLPETALLLHTCGSRGLDVFGADGEEPSCETGVLHPLWAVSEPERGADGLGEATWTVEGTDAAIDWADGFMSALGAECVHLSGVDRTLYHAAAVMAANLMVGALEGAVELAESAGMDRDDAHGALWPLAESALDNVGQELDADGLTGPVARGDETTVRRHLEAIEASGDEQLKRAYESLTDMCRRLVDDQSD